MKLKELFPSFNFKEKKAEEVEITGLSTDTRQLQPGEMFICLTGQQTKGSLYLEEAIEKGTSAVVMEEEVGPGWPIPIIKVKDIRRVLSKLAHRFYHFPSTKLRVIGITGTNGKTTTAWMIYSILQSAGRKCGIISTIGSKIDSQLEPAIATTPEAPLLHQKLAEMVNKGVEYAVIEVSSHSLSLHRVNEIDFNIACFTNLTQDHLDFHANLEAYFQAKLKLFKMLSTRPENLALVNADSPYLPEIRRNVNCSFLTFGIEKEADFRASRIEVFPDKISFQLNREKKIEAIELNLSGEFNVYNALASIGVAMSEGIEIEAIKAGLASFKGVPGRFERIEVGQKFLVLVDYAHTPDALKKLLLSARKITQGQIILVFGCGGNRDRGKRQVMGEIAASLSDKVIITSDNPREEDPLRIILDIEVGVMKFYKDQPRAVWKIIDRAEAIKKALSLAKDEDTVIIAGKGHENYQIIGREKKIFSDQETVRSFLS